MRVHACVCGRQRVHVRVRVRACVDLQKWGSDDCRVHMLDDWVRLYVNHRTTTWPQLTADVAALHQTCNH